MRRALWRLVIGPRSRVRSRGFVAPARVRTHESLHTRRMRGSPPRLLRVVSGLDRSSDSEGNDTPRQVASVTQQVPDTWHMRSEDTWHFRVKPIYAKFLEFCAKIF